MPPPSLSYRMLVRSLRDVSLSFRTIHCGSGGNWRSVHCARRLSFFPSLVHLSSPVSTLLSHRTCSPSHVRNAFSFFQSWSYAKGTFDVHIMDGGEFACPQYPRHSSWSPTASGININWASFGSYDMVVAADGASMEGCYAGYPDHWRKAAFSRAHAAGEVESIRAEMKAAHDAGKFGCSHH